MNTEFEQNVNPKELIHQCCVCHAIRQQNGVWNRQPILYRPEKMHITHGYCPRCYAKALDEISTTVPAYRTTRERYAYCDIVEPNTDYYRDGENNDILQEGDLFNIGKWEGAKEDKWTLVLPEKFGELLSVHLELFLVLKQRETGA
jgi:hypothetical protein